MVYIPHFTVLNNNHCILDTESLNMRAQGPNAQYIEVTSQELKQNLVGHPQLEELSSLIFKLGSPTPNDY